MNDERDEIRNRIDIVDLVSERVQLKRTGKNYSGLCPFHNDKSPSFFVSPSTGRYKCWSCGESGDAFTWVMKTQNLEFIEALKLLAEKTGVTLSRGFQGDKPDKSIREQQLLVMHAALIFFRNELKKNQAATKYLDGRDLDEKLQEEWELGFAPDVGEALVVHLKREGKSLASASELFLVQGDERTGYSDKYKGRITFALRDDRGDLVGFAGRVLGQSNTAKYINSGETPLYHKSKVLYGMHKAKDAIAKSRHAVLVEGYLDVIACHRAGVNTAVASCGTALAEDQARLLKRFADKVTILYDGDNAGQKAIVRALEVFDAAGLPCRVALLPPGDDPDTLLKSKGPEAVRNVVETSISPFDFEILTLEKNVGVHSDEFWQQVPIVLAKAPSELDLERHLLRLAGQHPQLKNPVAALAALRREVRQHRSAGGRERKVDRNPLVVQPVLKQIPPAEAVVLKAAMETELRNKAWGMLIDTSLFTTSLTIEISLELKKVYPEPPVGNFRSWPQNATLSEQTFSTLCDLEFDPRVQHITGPYLDDSYEKLKEQRASNELGKTRFEAQAGGDDDLKRYLSQLRKNKGIDP